MIVIAGVCLLDWERMRVIYDGRVLSLPLKRFRLLDILVRNADRVLARNEIKAQLWGANASVSDVAVNKEIERLRPYLSGPSGRSPIRTIRGVGYLFSTENGSSRSTLRETVQDPVDEPEAGAICLSKSDFVTRVS